MHQVFRLDLSGAVGLVSAAAGLPYRQLLATVHTVSPAIQTLAFL